MTVAQEMMELAEKVSSRRKLNRFETAIVLSARELELAETALRESALSLNEVGGERKI